MVTLALQRVGDSSETERPQRPRTLLARAGDFVGLLAHSPYRGQLLLLLVLIVGAIIGNAIGQVRLNGWQGTFYDALSRRNIPDFVGQLYLFLEIIAGLIVIGVLQTWTQEMIKVRLRQTVTGELFDQWMKPKRAYRLAQMGEIGVNPDQRLQEDAKHLSELTGDLSIGFLQSTLLLISFIGVLWLLSDQVVFNIGGRRMIIPGYMVWGAVIYAAAGSLLTWAVGRPLIRLNAEHYSREADLRYALVRASDSAEGIALYRGEATERRLLGGILNTVLEIMTRLANRLANLTWITSTYGFIAIVVPVVVASLGYFASTISFGGLMMVVGAFYQVQQALRWFIDNFSRIADWHATFLRVMTFREALLDAERATAPERKIAILPDPQGWLRFKDVRLLLADGEAALDETDATIRPGEHVLIMGGLGSGKTTLFRVLAGLSQAGSGSISLPPREAMTFPAAAPYLPLGPLRTALTYPASAAGIGDEVLLAALDRVGLGKHGEASLDEVRRWDRELTMGEQQCLVVARLLLQKPRWVVLDGSLDTLDEISRKRILSIFAGELSEATVISIGEASPDESFFTHVIQLRRLTAPTGAGGTSAAARAIA